MKLRYLILAGCLGALLLFGYALTNLAQEKPAATNAKPADTPADKVTNLSPTEAVKAMTLAEGFKATLFAGEPDVRQPNAFCIDDRGRLWVGENYTYSKVGWQPDDRDRILIFEDTNGTIKCHRYVVVCLFDNIFVDCVFSLDIGACSL